MTIDMGMPMYGIDRDDRIVCYCLGDLCNGDEYKFPKNVDDPNLKKVSKNAVKTPKPNSGEKFSKCYTGTQSKQKWEAKDLTGAFKKEPCPILNADKGIWCYTKMYQNSTHKNECKFQ